MVLSNIYIICVALEKASKRFKSKIILPACAVARRQACLCRSTQTGRNQVFNQNKISYPGT